MTSYRLSLGRNIGTDGRITNQDFHTFLQESVVPRFEGFSITHGEGYWQGKAELTSYLDVITGDPIAPSKLYDIAVDYTTRFHQDAVMLTTSPATVDMVTDHSTLSTAPVFTPRAA